MEIHHSYEEERDGKIKEEKPKELTTVEQERAKTLLNHPKLMNILLEDMDRIIAGEPHNKLLLFLIYCSAYMKDKIHPRMTGGSSGGKSYLLFNVANYVPEEDILIKATRMTGKALEYHIQGKNLNGKIMIMSEFEGAQDAIVSLRPMMSGEAGGLNLMTVQKDAIGNIVSKELKCEGIPVFCTASTAMQLDFEFENRTWKMEIDESIDQTDEVLEFLVNKELYEKKHISKLQEDVKNMIRYLKTNGIQDVKIIFAKKVKDMMPKNNLRVRRDFSKILSFIKVSAWIHQLQRPIAYIEDKPCILATLEDFDIATTLYSPSAEVTMYGRSKRALKVYDIVRRLAPDGKFIKTEEVVKRSGDNDKLVKMALVELYNNDFLFGKKDFEDKRKYVYALNPEKSLENWKISVSKSISLTEEEEKLYKGILESMEIGKVMYRDIPADSSSNTFDDNLPEEALSTENTKNSKEIIIDKDDENFVTTAISRCMAHNPFQFSISPILGEEALSTENNEEKVWKGFFSNLPDIKGVNMDNNFALPNIEEIKAKVYELNIFSWMELQMEFESRCHNEQDSKILQDNIKKVINEMKEKNMIIQMEEDYYHVVQ